MRIFKITFIFLLLRKHTVMKVKKDQTLRVQKKVQPARAFLLCERNDENLESRVAESEPSFWVGSFTWTVYTCFCNSFDNNSWTIVLQNWPHAVLCEFCHSFIQSWPQFYCIRSCPQFYTKLAKVLHDVGHSFTRRWTKFTINEVNCPQFYSKLETALL